MKKSLKKFSFVLCVLMIYAVFSTPVFAYSKDEAIEKNTFAVHQQGYEIIKKGKKTQTINNSGIMKQELVYKKSYYKQVGFLGDWVRKIPSSKAITIKSTTTTVQSLSKTMGVEIDEKINKVLSGKLGIKYESGSSTTKVISQEYIMNIPKYTNGNCYRIGFYRWVDEYEIVTYSYNKGKWVPWKGKVKTYIFDGKPIQELQWKRG